MPFSQSVVDARDQEKPSRREFEALHCHVREARFYYYYYYYYFCVLDSF